MRGRSQWLRGPESGRRWRVSVWSWGLGGVALHLQVWKHQLRTHTYQVRPCETTSSVCSSKAASILECVTQTHLNISESIWEVEMKPVFWSFFFFCLFPQRGSVFSDHLLQSLQIHGSVQPQPVLLRPHPLHGKQQWRAHIRSSFSALQSSEIVLKSMKISHLNIKFDQFSQTKALFPKHTQLHNCLPFKLNKTCL